MQQGTSRIFALWALSTLTATAAPLAWVSSTGTSDEEALKVTKSCPEDYTVIGGGVITESKYMASRFIEASVPYGSSAWRTVTSSVDGAPAEDRDYEVSALCAADLVAACVTRVDASWDPDTVSEKLVEAQCPAGMMAFAGGAEITGTTYGRGFRKLGPGGLFFPMSWTADVAPFEDDVSFGSDWGVHVVAYCAPASVFASHVEVMYGQFGDGACFDSSCMLPGKDYAADATYRYGYPYMPDLADCVHPLSVGISGAQGRFVVDSGARVASSIADYYEAKIGAFEPDLPNLSVGLCADNLNTFAADLAATCDDPGPPTDPDPFRIDLSRWAIGGFVLFGVIQDGGGVIILPGVGPVPVDPGPLWTVDDPLPIAVVPYQDSRSLGALLDSLTAELDEGRLDYTESVDVEDALGSSDLLLLTPEDEASAVAWLSEHRERLASRDTPVVVFLEQGGPGMGALERW